MDQYQKTNFSIEHGHLLDIQRAISRGYFKAHLPARNILSLCDGLDDLWGVSYSVARSEWSAMKRAELVHWDLDEEVWRVGRDQSIQP